MEVCRFNQCVKIYGDSYKITTFNKPVFNPYRLQTITLPRLSYQHDNNITRSDSVKRGIEKIFDIAYLNDFQYFVTLTLDKSKIDRTDISLINKKVKKWCNNQVNRYNAKYILVPEYHSDNKSVHFHGLCSGNFHLVNSGLFTKKGQVIYNLDNWGLGFSTCIELDGNKVAVSRYICKYITKDTKKIFGNFYLAGGKLDRDIPKQYYNQNFCDSYGKEYEVGCTGIKVKYYDFYSENDK